MRPLAEKMVTIGKKNTIHARRTAMAVLRQADSVKKLFEEVAPRSADRKGGYTRIVKLGMRKSDAAEMAFIEWVDSGALVETAIPEAKPAAKKAAKPKAAAPEKAPKKEKAPVAEEVQIEDRAGRSSLGGKRQYALSYPLPFVPARDWLTRRRAL